MHRPRLWRKRRPHSTWCSRRASTTLFGDRGNYMTSRRRFIRIGAATVGTMALRPFGLIPRLAAQSVSDYKALVCVFLFGGNDSNNLIVPMDSARFNAYTSIRGSL